QTMGLGRTGETYLFGQDFTMRNDARGLIEDKEGYLAHLEATGTDPAEIEQIRHLGTTIMNLKVHTVASELAMAGKAGFTEYRSQQQVSYLGAFTPLAIPGLHWGLVARIHADEAYAAATQLAWTILACILV